MTQADASSYARLMLSDLGRYCLSLARAAKASDAIRDIQD
jgi:hypothetical protein